MLRLRLTFPLAVLLCVLSASAQDALHAGPMLGPVTHRGATIWVQTARAADVALRYAATATADGAAVPRARPVTTAPVTAGPESDHIATFALTGLEPGWTYAYSVLVDGAEVERPYPTTFTTQPLWQWRTDPPAFTFAVGSCAYVNDTPYDRPGDPYGGDPRIFESIADLAPELMLWVGDNTYYREVDWWTPEGLAYRQRHTRGLPELQRLLATASHLAVWDDHDYGPNNSDRSYVLKGTALEVFARYWPGVTRGLPSVPGVFTHTQYADVEFFMLDNRYHRTPNDAPPGPDDTLLGAAQLQWLLDGLTSSFAPFKVIVSGGQVLNPVEVFENYSNVAPAERQFLLDEIARRGIGGVVFLSGDRHHSELMRMERPGAYPLHEFTSSPLTAGAVRQLRDAENPFRVPGTLVTGQRSFGTVHVEGPRTARVMTLRAHAADGSVLWEHRLAAADLRMPETDD